MRFAVDDSYATYFQYHGVIELEGVLQREALNAVKAEARRVLCVRMGRTADELDRMQPQTLAAHCRDMWREGSVIRRQLLSRDLCHALGALTEATHLRLACDQLLLGGVQYGEPCAAEELFCFQGLQAIVLVRLAGESEGVGNLPSTPGSITVIAPDQTLDLRSLAADQESQILVIALVDGRAQYVKRDRDPHTHHPKSLGYVFGDKLQEEQHPTLFRR